ncbi:MAG TPA: cyanase [Rariglobus sp.]
MNKTLLTARILEAKKARALTWSALAQASGLSEVYTTSACLGENALPPDAASRVATALDLGPDIAEALAEFACKGESASAVSKEPLQYRFQEILYVYGPTLKALIEEKFGAGIMSAIDFTLSVDRVADPRGDRVKIEMCGKFLGYKTW